MAFDRELAERISTALVQLPPGITNEFSEKQMFGGLAFLYKGKMTVGIVKDGLMVRVIQEKMQEVSQIEGVRPMDFTKKPMKEFLFVSPIAFETGQQMQYWVNLGLEHAQKKLKEIA